MLKLNIHTHGPVPLSAAYGQAFANFLGFPVVEEYQYGNLTMILYGRKKKLIDMCKALKRYEMEDFALIDKFFSKESVRDLIFLHWSSQVLILLIVTCENPIVSFVL